MGTVAQWFRDLDMSQTEFISTELTAELAAYHQCSEAMRAALEVLDQQLAAYDKPNFGSMVDQWIDRVMGDAFAFKRYCLKDIAALHWFYRERLGEK